jgi:hypothetical protein
MSPLSSFAIYGFGLIQVVDAEARYFRQMIAQHRREGTVLQQSLPDSVFANDAEQGRFQRRLA